MLAIDVPFQLGLGGESLNVVTVRNIALERTRVTFFTLPTYS